MVSVDHRCFDKLGGDGSQALASASRERSSCGYVLKPTKYH